MNQLKSVFKLNGLSVELVPNSAKQRRTHAPDGRDWGPVGGLETHPRTLTTNWTCDLLNSHLLFLQVAWVAVVRPGEILIFRRHWNGTFPVNVDHELPEH